MSEIKTETFKSKKQWAGHKNNQNGDRLLQDKLEAKQEFEKPKNENELESFFGAIQYLSKYTENRSAPTEF